VDDTGRIPYIGVPQLAPGFLVPDPGPVTSPESKVDAVVGKGAIGLIAGIDAEQLVELSGAGGTKQEVGRLLVGLQEVEPGLAFDIGTTHREGEDKPTVIVIRINSGSQRKLSLIVHTTDLLGFLLGLGQGRKQHPGQDGDDGNHHQQFDQGKCHPLPVAAQEGIGFRSFHDHWIGDRSSINKIGVQIVSAFTSKPAIIYWDHPS